MMVEVVSGGGLALHTSHERLAELEALLDAPFASREYEAFVTTSSVIEEEGGLTIRRQLGSEESYFSRDDRQSHDGELDDAKTMRIDVN